MHRIGLLILIAILFFSGCAPATALPTAVPTSSAQPELTATDTLLPAPTNTPASTATDSPTATSTKPPSLTITPLAEGRVIIKETAGLPITGTLYGHGETAVILASQGGTSESQWNSFAKDLAKNGFTALAISSPDSQGDTVVLVGQAIQFLRENGYRRIVCAGVSNGASGCAYNVTAPEITGLLLITYHGGANLSKLSLPKFFVTGEQSDPWRATTEAGFKAAGEPKTLIVVPNTPGTGPSILDVDQEIKKQVLEFLKTCNGL